ncbi:uncharacterized protein METZ01_LOCUS200008 [marine metagenome]|uniref:Uncharacterized protein n=1 Tax=marine metagenome TaxID=408172 RepID=A0A382EAR3_9ZZZZ
MAGASTWNVCPSRGIKRHLTAVSNFDLVLCKPSLADLQSEHGWAGAVIELFGLRIHLMNVEDSEIHVEECYIKGNIGVLHPERSVGLELEHEKHPRTVRDLRTIHETFAPFGRTVGYLSEHGVVPENNKRGGGFASYG